MELAAVKPGELAYVSGLGSIGLFTVSGLVAAGCRVVGADPRAERRSMAVAMGCEEVFDNTKEDPVVRTTQVDPHGPRAAFECAGTADSLQQIFDVCGHEGVVALLGIALAPVLLLRMTLKELRAFSIRGPSMDSMRRALDLLRDHPRSRDVITDVVPLEEIGPAFARLAEGTGGVKVLVAPGG